jgi:hypothetical protein
MSALNAPHPLTTQPPTKTKSLARAKNCATSCALNLNLDKTASLIFDYIFISLINKAFNLTGINFDSSPEACTANACGFRYFQQREHPCRRRVIGISLTSPALLVPRNLKPTGSRDSEQTRTRGQLHQCQLYRARFKRSRR